VTAQQFQADFFALNPPLRPALELMASEPKACFFVKDRQSRYVMCNRFHLVTYDLVREDDLVGKAARDYFPDLLAEAYEANDRTVFESSKHIWNEVWLVPHVRGTPRWFVSSKAPLFDLNGEIMGLAGLMHPIATPEDQRQHFRELQRVVEFLETNFVGEIDAEKLASIAGLSIPHFNRRFRELLRLSPMEYVQSLRIQEAQRLLATTQESVAEISAATGYYDQSHFTKRFKKVTGITPLKYRREFLR